MAVTDLAATVVIGGASQAGHILSIERHVQLCRPGQVATITLDAGVAHAGLNPWDTLVITEQGTTVFTGFVDDVVPSRAPNKVTIAGTDTYKRAKCWFISDNTLETNGETVSYWINYLCGLCGLSYVVDSSGLSGAAITMDNQVPIGLRTVDDALMDVCGYGMLYMRVAADGVLHFLRLDAPVVADYNFDLTAIEKKITVRELDVRNAVKIFGYAPPGGSPVFYKETRVVSGISPDRTMVFGSPNIDTTAKATTLAQAALDQFAIMEKQGDIKLIGNPAIIVGQTGQASLFTENILAHISDLSSSHSESGYEQNVILSRRCPRLPGFTATPVLRTVYVVEKNRIARTRNFGAESPHWEDLTPTMWSGSTPRRFFKDFHLDPGDPVNSAWIVVNAAPPFLPELWHTTNLDDPNPTWIWLIDLSLATFMVEGTPVALEDMHRLIVLPNGRVGLLGSTAGSYAYTVVFNTFDYGNTWSSHMFYPSRTDVTRAMGFAIPQNNPNVVYVGLSSGEIWAKSGDFPFYRATFMENGYVHDIVANSVADGFAAGTSDSGHDAWIAVTSDGWNTHSFITPPFLSSKDKPVGVGNGAPYSMVGGKYPIGRNMIGVWTHSFDAHGAEGGRFASVWNGGGLWVQSASHLPFVGTVAPLYFDTTLSPFKIFALTREVADGRIICSFDAGASWTNKFGDWETVYGVGSWAYGVSIEPSYGNG